jgi:hypothetical protein
MGRMTRSHARVESDVESRCQDGSVIHFQIKRAGADGLVVQDLLNHAELQVSGPSAGFVGAASVFGWYVRSGAPWSDHLDSDGLHADWQAVGDDLWRAIVRVADAADNSESSQSRLFDPADFAGRGSRRT